MNLFQVMHELAYDSHYVSNIQPCMREINEPSNEPLVHLFVHNHIFTFFCNSVILFKRRFNKFTSEFPYLFQQIQYVFVLGDKYSSLGVSHFNSKKVLKLAKVFDLKFLCQLTS